MFRVAATNNALKRGSAVVSRGYHAGKPRQQSLLEADSSKPISRAYHFSGLALAVLTPAAFVISPSSLNLPVDLALGVIFPLHNHVAFNYIISDYVPKATKGAARIGLVGLTVVMIAGLTKLNLTGPGITESLKGLWRKKVTEK